MSPLVSIIVPTKNRAARLPGAIDSALTQSIDDLEVIVVDDASTDGTARYLSDLVQSDHRVRALTHDAATGPSSARNDGIAVANGRFIAFLDDDDRWYPSKLEEQLAYLDAHPRCSAVTCFFDLTDERGGSTAAFRGPERYPAASLVWANFPASNLGLVRRDAFETIPLFDPELRTCEDWDYWVSCARNHEVATVPKVLAQVVFHGEQSAFDHVRRAEGRTRFIEKHRAQMSQECLAYNHARTLLVGTEPGSERLRLHMRFLATLRGRARYAIAAETLSARRGIRRGDPGRGLRTLLRIIGEQP